MDDIFKRVFLRLLPPAIVTAITPSLSASFDVVVDATDKAWTAAASAEAQTASVFAISGPPGPAGRGSKRGGCQRGFRTSGQVINQNLCSLHRKFRDLVKKCVSGCSRWGEERQRDSPAARMFHLEEALDGEDAQGDTASGNL